MIIGETGRFLRVHKTEHSEQIIIKAQLFNLIIPTNVLNVNHLILILFSKMLFIKKVHFYFT